MKVSVIIPVHNGGEDLGRCLEALTMSATRPDEVIVVDDASTDGSAEVARRRGAQVVCVPAPCRGPAFARNRGAEIAGGEILFFTDADVMLHPDAIAEAYWDMHQQHRSAWTLELDVRPWSENF